MNSIYEYKGPVCDEYMGMWLGTYSNDIRLESDIVKAIQGEIHDYNFYQSLAEFTDQPMFQQVIRGIQQDEAKHYNWFTSFLNHMGGRVTELPEIEMPTDFVSGLQSAIQDELKAAKFYHDISIQAVSQPIQTYFLYSAMDEQRHASLLQNTLLELCC